jgi:SWI/SNF related-matrix-associated actin-dependent regulator of chromatin subfamily C
MTSAMDIEKEFNSEIKADIDQNSMQVAAAAALAAASVKAQVIAEKQEREIYNLVSKAVDLQLKKIELKMKAFDDIDQLVERERILIERARQGIAAEVMNLAQKMNAQRNLPNTPTTPSVLNQ